MWIPPVTIKKKKNGGGGGGATHTGLYESTEIVFAQWLSAESVVTEEDAV